MGGKLIGGALQPCTSCLPPPQAHHWWTCSCLCSSLLHQAKNILRSQSDHLSLIPLSGSIQIPARPGGDSFGRWSYRPMQERRNVQYLGIGYWETGLYSWFLKYSWMSFPMLGLPSGKAHNIWRSFFRVLKKVLQVNGRGGWVCISSVIMLLEISSGSQWHVTTFHVAE